MMKNKPPQGGFFASNVARGTAGVLENLARTSG
jgi:hypothetical protein